MNRDEIRIQIEDLNARVRSAHLMGNHDEALGMMREIAVLSASEFPDVSFRPMSLAADRPAPVKLASQSGGMRGAIQRGVDKARADWRRKPAPPGRIALGGPEQRTTTKQTFLDVPLPKKPPPLVRPPRPWE